MNDERLGLPSASGANILYNCPASPRLQALAPPEEETTEVADEGTVIHEAMETEDGSELTLTQAEITERLTRLKEAGLRRWLEDFPIKDKGWEFREERFWITDLDGNRIASAKPDWGIIIGDHAYILDWKSGWKQVGNAASSIQGRFQAVAIYCENQELVHVRIGFAQARLSTFYTECDYKLNDLQYARNEIIQAKWRSERPDAPAIPGEWCLYCRAKAYCKAAGAITLLPSREVKNGQVFTQKQDPVAIRDAVYAMTIPDLVAIFERRTIIENVLDAVKRRLKGLPEETLKELGYEKQKGARYITKVEVNPLFQALWDDGFWNHIPAETRQDEAVKEFSTFTTALTGKLENVALPRLITSGRFKLTKDAKAHLRELLEKCSEMDTKEQTVRKIKE